jgi:hypothetical protein
MLIGVAGLLLFTTTIKRFLIAARILSTLVEEAFLDHGQIAHRGLLGLAHLRTLERAQAAINFNS